MYSNNFVYCTATVQLATFRTDLDLRQAKLRLCTTKDKTELLTGCLNSVWPHSVVHVSLLVCPLCCILALVCIFGVMPQRGARRCVASVYKHTWSMKTSLPTLRWRILSAARPAMAAATLE